MNPPSPPQKKTKQKKTTMSEDTIFNGKLSNL